MATKSIQVYPFILMANNAKPEQTPHFAQSELRDNKY